MEEHNKLDVAAKLYPTIKKKNNSAVFRVATILNEEIDPKTLQLAVNMIYERYHLFFLRLREGFFWNYFDKNYIHFTVEKEEDSPCSTIIAFENKGYILKVLYYGNRISVEAFHSITDGSGIVEFLKSLVYYYICMKHGNVDSQGKVLLFDERDEANVEDSFSKHFSQQEQIKKSPMNKFAFRLSGKKYKRKGHCVVSGIVSVAAMKQVCKKHSCTITEFLIANLISAIYEEKQKLNSSKKAIVVAVPINLRKIFPSKTLKNFFGVAYVGYQMTEFTTFEELILSISEQLSVAIHPEKLESDSGKNVKMIKNAFSKSTPLVIKKMFIPLGYSVTGESVKTISVSNIGKIDFPDGIKPYVEHMEVLMYPTQKTPLNCGLCSFEDKLSINFIRSITDTSVIRRFFTTLTKRAETEVQLYSNGWGGENEQMQ